MSNAFSYDPKMEDMPVVISYSRSGSNWLNCISELYFGKPRLRLGPVSFIKNDREDLPEDGYLWFHDHDLESDLTLSHDHILYMYRDPRDVIYSIISAEHIEPTKDIVNLHMDKLKNQYRKYVINGLARESLKYEDLKRNLSEGFIKIIDFLEYDGLFDQHFLNQCAKKVTKKEVISLEVDKRYFSEKLLTKSYELERVKFKKDYGDYIKQNIMSGEFSDMFR